MKEHGGLFSQLYHFLVFLMKRPKTQFEKGMLIISVDADVCDKELGVLNRGQNDANISSHSSEYSIGEIEERSLPLFIDLFDNFEVPVTFAVRGQVVEVDDSFLNLIRKSTMKHDIGAHGYYHREFTNLFHSEAENELNMISIGMKKFGITPLSFVFPKNSVAHLDLLVKYGYKCYRGRGGFVYDCMLVEKSGELYNIHPSLYIDQHAKITFLKKILDISTTKKLPFHIWFHLWSFGQEDRHIERSINNIFFPLLDYAKREEENGMLTFETMLSAAEKVEKYPDL